ncbi:hypothetical protein [Streptomyces mirabilis]|uniref:hypothetical protein n=1 Tax=Streptomyces mirabilis TaxID=68239 RepID=UPI002252FF0C|nr:hypothetical protein [Streptomyces mirabilis]MCX4428536.1 hypothetical protein [Streptomyces mirabilis]
MLQAVLAEDEWAGLLTGADRRGMTPLFWSHVRTARSGSTWAPGLRSATPGWAGWADTPCRARC